MLLPYYQDKFIEAGCDEAGRGCLCGPVFAAAVILPKDYENERLNDSKQLTEKVRYELREEILRDAIAWGVGTADEKEIDEVNILRASIRSMHRAVDSLAVRPGYLIIDGNRFIPYKQIPYSTIVKGDGKYLSIAAASILAKTFRDDFMNRIAQEYPEYNWSQNKGYPTKDHKEAIEKYGITPYHRLSFHLGGKSGPRQLSLFEDI